MSYSNGRGYRGRTYGERVRWNRKEKENRRLKIEISKELGILGCWLCEFKYAWIDDGERKEHLYQKFANGEGEVARHLCGDGRCSNPAHLIRGSNRENIKDESKLQLFGVYLLREILKEEYSDMTQDEEFMMLQTSYSKIRHWKLTNTTQFVREEYRKVKEIELVSECKERIIELREKLLSIINFIEIKESR